MSVLLAIGLVGVGALPASADAATITACVKSKGGDVRFRSGAAARKKCPKGWKRLRWSTTSPAGRQGKPGIQGVAGPQGIPGPVGPKLNVKDATGAVVGQFVGALPQGGTVFFVLRDGGIWWYLGSGQLFPIGSPTWKTSDCTGSAHLRANSSGLGSAVFAQLVSGTFRLTFRTLSAGTFGSATGWTGNGAIETIPATQLYRLNGTTGACETDGVPYAGDLVGMSQVPAPPDYTGPLTID